MNNWIYIFEDDDEPPPPPSGTHIDTNDTQFPTENPANDGASTPSPGYGEGDGDEKGRDN